MRNKILALLLAATIGSWVVVEAQREAKVSVVTVAGTPLPTKATAAECNVVVGESLVNNWSQSITKVDKTTETVSAVTYPFCVNFTHKPTIGSRKAIDAFGDNDTEEFIQARIEGLTLNNLVRRCREVAEVITKKGFIKQLIGTSSHDDIFESKRALNFPQVK